MSNKIKIWFLQYISRTKQRNFKPFFSAENWDPYGNFEYRTKSVQLKGKEIFAKQNMVFTIVCCIKLIFFFLSSNKFLETIEKNTNRNLVDHLGQVMDLKGYSGGFWTTQEPFWWAEGHSCTVRATAGQNKHQLLRKLILLHKTEIQTWVWIQKQICVI